MYKENPKTKGSGIITCIPQTGICPNKCEDCFFQSGRSYLEPLAKNLPNMPGAKEARGRIVRVNDGNDSNVNRKLVIAATKKYRDKFYNTAIPKDLGEFGAPVVLTVNPGKMTNERAYLLGSPPLNLMFVRFRVNMWNLWLCDEVVEWYEERQVPIVLTFMAYFAAEIPGAYEKYYIFRRRTINSYWAITTNGWEEVMRRYKYNPRVYSCGKIEGEKGTTACRYCGNCLREYYAAKERMRAQEKI